MIEGMKHFSRIFNALVLTSAICGMSFNATAQNNNNLTVDPSWVTEYAPTAANDDQACVAHYSYDIIQTGTPDQIRKHMQWLYDNDRFKDLSVYDQIDLMTRLSKDKIEIKDGIMDAFFFNTKNPPSLSRKTMEMQRQFIKAVKSDASVPKTQEEWMSIWDNEGPEKALEIINKIIAIAANAYGVSPPSVKFLVEKTPTGNALYNGSTNTMVIHSGSEEHGLYNLVELITTLDHEMYHAYQFKLGFTKLDTLPEDHHGVSTLYYMGFSDEWFWGGAYDSPAEHIVQQYEMFTTFAFQNEDVYERLYQQKIEGAKRQEYAIQNYQSHLSDLSQTGKKISCPRP